MMKFSQSKTLICYLWRKLFTGLWVFWLPVKFIACEIFKKHMRNIKKLSSVSRLCQPTIHLVAKSKYLHFQNIHLLDFDSTLQ